MDVDEASETLDNEAAIYGAESDFDNINSVDLIAQWGPELHFNVEQLEELAKEADMDLQTGNLHLSSTFFASTASAPIYHPPCPTLIKINPALADPKYQYPPESKQLAARSASTKTLSSSSTTRKRSAKRSKTKLSPLNTRESSLTLDPKSSEPPKKRKKRPIIDLIDSPRMPNEDDSSPPSQILLQNVPPPRISLASRVKHLGLTPHSDRTLSSMATIRLVCDSPEDSPEMERAKLLKRGLGKIEGINARIPKSGAVAGKLLATHVVVPSLNYPSLFTTVALSKGAWRVPYEWAEETLRLSMEAGKIVLADETDPKFSAIAFRSKYYFFKDNYFKNLLKNEDKRDEIQVVLDQAGAICAGPDQTAQIIVVDDDQLPPSHASDPVYWLYSDFLTTFDCAGLSHRAKEFRDWDH